MDFTLKTYRHLLDALLAKDYAFQPFIEFLERPAARAIILRHDVEARYRNALEIARIQHSSGIRGTYYFRLLPRHVDMDIIREIAAMGHEIGYHYDDLSYCKGNHEKAIRRFEQNLATLREIAPVKTICMEGAPLSKWDNRDLWSRQSPVPKSEAGSGSVETRNPKPETRNYRSYGIIGEPYFDLDFSKVFYLTDTGRRWDGSSVSVRDKVVSRQSSVETRNPKPETRNSKLRNTRDIIAAANAGRLPDQVMITFHPQRWNDSFGPWLQELLWQNVKNVGKRFLVKN